MTKEKEIDFNILKNLISHCVRTDGWNAGIIADQIIREGYRNFPPPTLQAMDEEKLLELAQKFWISGRFECDVWINGKFDIESYIEALCSTFGQSSPPPKEKHTLGSIADLNPDHPNWAPYKKRMRPIKNATQRRLDSATNVETSGYIQESPEKLEFVECQLCRSKEHETLSCEMATVYRAPLSYENIDVGKLSSFLFTSKDIQSEDLTNKLGCDKISRTILQFLTKERNES